VGDIGVLKMSLWRLYQQFYDSDYGILEGRQQRVVAGAPGVAGGGI